MEKIVNIAELKQRVGVANSNISLLGYYSAGDNGGGEFYWDSTSTETDNGGTIIQVTGVATGRWKRLYQGGINVKYFGAKGDDINDDTIPIQNCINFAISINHKQVYIPIGIYKITSTLLISEGLMIKGDGSQGSTIGLSATFKHYSNGDLFVFENTGRSFYGTGGGLKDGILIVKENGYNGGKAIKIFATNDSNRPGEMMFENILIYGSGTGTWLTALDVDGTNCNTAGSKGVRSISLFKFRVAGCTNSNKYINLNQVTHFSGNFIQIDKANGTGNEGMTIQGESTNVFFSNSNIPYINIDSTGTDINFSSTFCIQIFVNTTNIKGQYNGVVDDRIINKSKDFSFSTSKNPAFLGRLTSLLSNITGDGSQPTINFNDVVFDKNTQYSSGVYTILVAGRYRISSRLQFIGIDSSHFSSNGYIEHRNSTSSIVGIYENIQWKSGSNLPQRFVEANDVVIECNYGDTISVKPYVAGGTKTVSVLNGTSSNQYCTNLSINYIS